MVLLPAFAAIARAIEIIFFNHQTVTGYWALLTCNPTSRGAKTDMETKHWSADSGLLVSEECMFVWFLLAETCSGALLFLSVDGHLPLHGFSAKSGPSIVVEGRR